MPRDDGEPRLAAERHLRLLGWRDDVADLLAAADLFVLPSLWEGLPLAVLEAMAVGLPVVATDVCGTREVVVDDVTGRLVPSANPHELAVAVSEALADAEALRAWGAAGRDRYEAHFTAARMVEENVAVYEEASGERRTAATRAPRTRVAHRLATRVALVGAGYIAGRHARALASMADVAVVAVADPIEDRAEALAGPIGARAYRDWSSLLDHEDLDALFVCVPPFAHGAIERAAIERALPFLVEKPLAADLATAEDVARAVPRAAS